MERGCWLVLLCLLAGSVCAANESVGTFKKMPGENWTIDGHAMSVVKRDIMEEGFIYVSFDEIIRSLSLRQCSWFKNYEVCFTNSTLGSNFSYEWGATPYVYWLDVDAQTAGITIDTTASKSRLVLGQVSTIEMGVRNTGLVPIEAMNVSMDITGFAASDMHGPCRVQGTDIRWQGRLYMGEALSCWFDLRPYMTKTLDLKVTASYDDGRKATTTTGRAVKLEAKGDLVTIKLANTSAPLGGWMNGNITLDNTLSGKNAWFKGSLKAPGTINGTVSFDEMVPEGETRAKNFLVQLQNVGNNTITLAGSYRVDAQTTPLTITASCIAAEPRLKLSFFGDKQVAQNTSARVYLEGQNAEDYALRNVQAAFTVDGEEQSPGVLIARMDPGANEQLYITTIRAERSTGIRATVSYETPFGERLRKNATFNVTVPGTTPAPAKKTTNNTATVTADTGTTAPSGTGKTPTTKQASTTQTAPAGTGKTNLILLAAVLGVVGIAGLWLVLQSKKAPEE